MDVRKWDDIGYHFMIEGSGKIYEGRALYFKGAHVENATDASKWYRNHELRWGRT